MKAKISVGIKTTTRNRASLEKCHVLVMFT